MIITKCEKNKNSVEINLINTNYLHFPDIVSTLFSFLLYHFTRKLCSIKYTSLY